jgi:hypothetical protein
MEMKRSNQLSKGGAAGGLGSRALTPKTNVYFGGQPSQRVSPGGVSQAGSALGNHSTDSGKNLRGAVEPMYGGSFGGPGSTKLGNEVALNVGGGGVGTGRVLYGQSGTQAQHGAVSGSRGSSGSSGSVRKGKNGWGLLKGSNLLLMS